MPGGDAGRADEHVLGARGERLRALLHPDRAQHARPRVDADREPAPHAELGVLVDPHDLLARPQPVEHAPLPQVAQVVGGALPAQDGEPAQLVDLPLVAVGSGVGEHPAGGVLDADDAVGEQRDRLGEREEVVGPRGFARVEHSARRATPGAPSARPTGTASSATPASTAAARSASRSSAYAATASPPADGPPSVGLFGATAAPTFTATAAAPAAPAARTRRTASRPAGADDEDEAAAVLVGRVLGIDDGQAADRHVEARGSGQHRDQRLADGREELAQSAHDVVLPDDSDGATLADRTSPRRAPRPTVPHMLRSTLLAAARSPQVRAVVESGPFDPLVSRFVAGATAADALATARVLTLDRLVTLDHLGEDIDRPGAGRRQRRGLRAHPRAGWATRASPTGSRCR